MALPDPPDRTGVDTVFLGKMFSDVIDVPLWMIIESLENEGLRLWVGPVPGSSTLRPSLSRKQSIDTSRLVPGHPGIDGKTTLLHRTSRFRDGDFATEDTFNNRGLHRCEGVTSVGFHAATVEHKSVSLIAAIRNKESTKNSR